VGKTGKLAELQAELEGDLREFENRFDPELEELETVTVRLRKSDVEVRLVALAWDPR
jgi:hypothetical protein